LISFKQALRTKDFVITAELPLRPESTRESILADAAPLAASVDAFLLTDNQHGEPHMAPSYAAQILQSDGKAPILQVSCRNRNRIALIGEILGARAAGIDSLLLVRGAVLPEGYAPRPAAVMDTDAKDLIATAKIISDGTAPGAELLLGASATVHDPDSDALPAELIAKADAGAKFLVTQVCLSVDILRRYMAYLVGQGLTRRLSVIVSTAVVDSPEAALWVRNNRRGTLIPDDYVDKVAAAPDPAEFAVEHARTFVRALHTVPGVSGVNLAVAGDPNLIATVLESCQEHAAPARA